MKVSDLTRWGIPERIIEVWQTRQGEALLPVQIKAVKKGLLGSKENSGNGNRTNMLISAPTSAGKSFCAEMAAVKALTERTKSIMLFPLRSLAEENYRLIERTYGPLGVKPIIVTSDHPENDKLFREGKYEIAVAVYEKFDLLLTAALDSLANIGLIVVDEIQSIGEPGRGALLERLLTKVVASDYKPVLICLSAVIGDSAVSAGRLADWLGAVIVEETARPVDLIRGVASEGRLYHRSYNTGHDDSESFVTVQSSESPSNKFDAFVEQIKSETDQILVFLKSRAETVEYAFRLAGQVGWSEAKTAREKLSEEEPSSLNCSLRQALGRGVAFHNSDLTSRQREIIEEAFRNKEVRCLFSTTTLAMGVNLFADTVYLETVKYSSPLYGLRPSLIPISQAEFDNMTGRAGRHKNGGEVTSGRAIVLAYSDLEREILWQNYIAPEKPKPVESSFNSIPVIDWTLDIISSGLAADVAGLNKVFSKTFYMAGNAPFDPSTPLGAGKLRMTLPASSEFEKPKMTAESGVPDFETILENLMELSLIKYIPESGQWTTTALGKAAAGSGLSVNEARCFAGKLESGYPQTLFGWLALALGSPEWMPPPGFLTRLEIAHESPLKLLYQHFDSCLDQTRFLLPENHRSEPLRYQTAAALKALLLLDGWCRMTPIQRLEEQFQVHLGQIVSLAETVSHLIKSIAAIVGAREKDSPLIDELQDYAFQIRYGVTIEFRPLYYRLNSILNRSDLVTLKEAGIETVQQLCEISEEDLDNSLQNRLSPKKLNLLKEKIETTREEEFMSSLNTNPPQRTSTARRMNTIRQIHPEMNYRGSHPVQTEPGAVQLLEIDGSSDKERYVIRVNGRPLRLTAKSFKYLTKLAWWRANNPAASGWVYKEDIEVGYNQARYLYRMKNEIGDALDFDWPAVENNRLGYYRLNVAPEKVRINLANLQNHPDYEIRQMVSAAPAVN